MHSANFKFKRDGHLCGLRKLTFLYTTGALPFRGKKGGHQLLVSHVDCYCQLFNHYKWCCILYSAGQWCPDLWGEKCQLSPQLHSKAKSQSGHRHQRSPMMWLDPAQSMDAGSWPLVTMSLMGEQLDKEKGKNESEQGMWELKCRCLENRA